MYIFYYKPCGACRGESNTRLCSGPFPLCPLKCELAPKKPTTPHGKGAGMEHRTALWPPPLSPRPPLCWQQQATGGTDSYLALPLTEKSWRKVASSSISAGNSGEISIDSPLLPELEKVQWWQGEREGDRAPRGLGLLQVGLCPWSSPVATPMPLSILEKRYYFSGSGSLRVILHELCISDIFFHFYDYS